jgi:signal transduction histidine kinase
MASFNDALGRTTDGALGAHRLLLYTLAAVSGGASGDRETVDALEQLDAQGSQSWIALRLSDDKATLFRSGIISTLDSGILKEVDSTHLASRVEQTDTGTYLLLIAGRFETKNGSRYLESVYDISSVFDARRSQEDIYRKAFAAVVIIGAAVSWLLSLWLTRPLQKLSAVTRKIASGDLSCRAYISGKDEVGKLALDFNFMTDRLEDNISELRDTMQRQEAFMGYFAHELKTPMTSIIGYADLLRSHELSPNDRREAANYVFSEGRRLELLSLKLLDLIVLKKRDLVLVPMSVKHIVTEVVRLLRPVIVKSGITVRYQCDDGLCLLEPDLFKSLLINLADNARKALDSGGQILIESRALADGCVIRVADNGRGIPESELTRITDAFYRVDKSRSRAQGGAGLGLSLCSEIVALHNGTMTFESIVGKGTIVTVELKGGKTQ